MVYAYIRQVPNAMHLAEQKKHILSFSLANNLSIDKEVVEYARKDLEIDKRDEFEDFLKSMSKGDKVIVSSLSVLSSRSDDIIKVINCMISHDVELHISESKRIMTKDSTIIEILPLLNSLRETQRDKTTHIGRPKGSKSNSKFDIYQSKIINFLDKGLSVSAISRELKISRSSLKDYIVSRGIKELVEGSWIEMTDNKEDKNMNNVLLVCPFDKK